MKDQSENNISSQFLKTDGGKTKSNSIEVPSISLPKGGGAIKGIDEKFSVNSVNGTASFSIPLPFSPTRGVAPKLSISYNSGSGNGVFGLGWNMSLPSIKRKTDKKLPKYLDNIDSDIFLFSEAEDLVPEFKKENDGSFSIDGQGNYIINEIDSADTLFQIRFYRPRIEGIYARIERWTEKSTDIIKWRVITKENVTTLFGWSSNSVIADPENNSRIAEWFPEFVFDDKGNCSHYIYKKEDKSGINDSLLHNRNRLESGDINYTNTYLEKIVYGNKTPYKNFGDAYLSESDYMFQTIFDFGEYDTQSPYAKIKEWDFRLDAFSNYKQGFEVRNTRLCRRVMLHHFFPELPQGSSLIKSVNFEYDTSSVENFTFLKSITTFGYIKLEDGSYTHKKLPAIEFEYQKPEWDKSIRSIAPNDLIHSPIGIDEIQFQFTDLYNEGLSGILTEQSNGWYYKQNLGDGKFEQAKLISPKPSFIGLGTQLQLADLDADGGKQLVNLNSEPRGYFELNDDNQWQMFRKFKNIPNIDFNDQNLRILDLNGDGIGEIMITEDNVFTWYESEGRNGYSEVHKSIKSFDEESGPNLIFSDPLQTIFLADMSGDGLTDLVRIRNGEFCYWPNIGYGKFGKKVLMDNSPVFDYPEVFNPNYIRLADIDGSGTADVIYLGKNKITCWMNLNGNAWQTLPLEIDSFPDIHSKAKVNVVDLLGNGVACVVWSDGLAKHSSSPLKYIDLMNSKKPHLMVSYKNNFGKEVSLQYLPSTKFYIEDKLNGNPWITKLHFPVHCISQTEVNDKISGFRFISCYKYHHGYYDHVEREFRGFGMVEQSDTEYFENWVQGSASNIVEKELHQDPIITKSWFHTGAFLRNDKILNQFESEYWFEEMIRKGFAVTHPEIALPEFPIIPGPGLSNVDIDHLNVEEWQEALRSCKGMPLRSEIFGLDAPTTGATPDQIKKQLTPYSVATHNYTIELLQPKGKNGHAVFSVKESETLTYSYERNSEDPRIAHQLNVKLDEYGNVLESASVVYPRAATDLSLPLETQQEQNKTIIIYTENTFTNDVIDDDKYRLRLPAETKTYELKGLNKSSAFYSICDFDNILNNSNDVPYHQINNIPLTGTTQKRLIEHTRALFYKNDLSSSLPLYQLESYAIPFESYQLAFTPELLNDIYGTKVTSAHLTEGKYTHLQGDLNWWIRSGTIQFIKGTESFNDARNRFFVPISYIDPFGSKTQIKYYSNYFLFIEETKDELENRSFVELFNFRTLSPQRMRDINNNLSEAISDELGFVKATAVYGKGSEADDLTGLTEYTTFIEQNNIDLFFSTSLPTDLINQGINLLQHSTTRFVYDFDVYKNSGKPTVVASIGREEHYQKNNSSPTQLSFEYTNGMGSVIMKKTQAEPGLAKRLIINPDQTYNITEEDTAALIPKQLRWIGNGRTILNNKGNAVKKYEPYFSTSSQYEDQKELVEIGVTPIIYYDALGRQIKTEMPDETLSRIEFDSWKKVIFDANDTILESAWYNKRTNRLIDAELIANGKDPLIEKSAADKTALHANTPTILHFDTMGRPVLSVTHNRNITTNADEFYNTKAFLDTEGNLRKVNDARELIENGNKGNSVMQYKYDMLGNLVYLNSMDSGQRWLLNNILGNPVRTWDEREHEFQYFYDVMHRPTQSKVIGGDGAFPLDHIYDRVIYGESLLLPLRSNEASLQSKNLIGKVIKKFDTAGVIETPEFDFKGQPISNSRKLFSKYKEIPNWIDANLISDLETQAFTFVTESDALGRIFKQTAPDGSIITPAYNRTGLFIGDTVNHPSPEVTTVYIKNIDYNEKGQRQSITYGNDVITNFFYDKETFRLNRLETKRLNNDPLQDWNYTFDPVGNITQIVDKNIPVVFFNNQKVSGVSEYTYDALYRLAEATGRENDAALSFNTKDNWNDAPYIHEMNPGDPLAVRNYTQRYQYDEVGNIKQMRHQASGNNWTRDFDYEKTNNRLKSTQIGSETYQYTHHLQHGFITTMPHLEEMGWNFKEELIKTIKQKVNPGNGTPETTYYQYDGQGKRIRKITENFATEGSIATKKEERIYVSGYETFRSYKFNSIDFERDTLSLIDQGKRFVMIETVKCNNDPSPSPSESVGGRLVRYQLDNHLGSSSLELDTSAQIISYEEYHPFGTTSYQAKNANIKSAAKRYGYAGMERDEETGLEYHAARYYLPWLGRWISSDPIGISDGLNRYSYCKGNPIMKKDSNGKQSQPVANDGDPNNPNNYIDFDSFRAGAMGPWSAEGLRAAWESAHPPTPELVMPSDNVLFRRSGYLQLADGSGQSTVLSDPNIAENGFTPTNPLSTATAAQHARGMARSVVTIDGQDVVKGDSPWISTSQVRQPETSYSGPEYVIDANLIPADTPIVRTDELLQCARDEGISHPAFETSQLQGYPATDTRAASPPEMEALVGGNIPPEAITPVADLPTVTPEVVLPTTGMAGWIGSNGTTVGRGFMVVGAAITVYNLGSAGVTSYNVGSARPILAQVIREAGSWGGGIGGSYLGGLAGVAIGGGGGAAAAAPTGELAAPVTVPAGAVIGGFLGSIGGGILGSNLGYRAADYFADMIYPN